MNISKKAFGKKNPHRAAQVRSRLLVDLKGKMVHVPAVNTIKRAH